MGVGEVVLRSLRAGLLCLYSALFSVFFSFCGYSSEAFALPTTVKIEVSGLGLDTGNPSSPFDLPLTTNLVAGVKYKVKLTGKDTDTDSNNQGVNNITFDMAITNGTLTAYSWLVTGDIDDSSYTNSVPGIDNPGQVSTDTFSGHQFPTQVLIDAGLGTPLPLAVVYFTAGAAGSQLEIDFDSNPYVSGFATDNSHYGVNGTSYKINQGQCSSNPNMCLKFKTNVISGATYSISGTVLSGGSGLINVVVSDGTRSATTNASGAYTITGVPNGSYTLTATKSGYSISPGFTNPVVVSGANVTGKNFTATQQQTYSISGTVLVGSSGLSSVVVSDGTRSATTNASGAYTITGVPNGNYTLSATRSGYSITPSNFSNPLTINGANSTNKNFAAAAANYSISGTVLIGSAGLSNVVVSTGSKTATTNSSGAYTITGLTAGSYTLSAARTGYTISASFSNPVVITSANISGKNFSATANTYSISGTVLSGSSPLANVVVSLGSRSGTTNSSGQYVITGNVNGSYTLSATLAGYSIVPSNFSNPVVVNGANVTGQNFLATLGSGIAPLITVQPESQGIPVGEDVTFSVSASGTGPLSYQWLKKINQTDVPIAGATSQTFTISSIEKTDGGLYRVRVSNASGSVLSSRATLTVTTAAGSPTLADGSCAPGLDCVYEDLNAAACAGVNGFFGQINIASIINLKNSSLRAKVEYRDSLGTLRGSVTTTIAPLLKKDIIANELGLVKDSYGTLCVSTNASESGAWIGGITLYKEDARPGQNGYDFALYYPFTNPKTAAIFSVPLNTFHLGTSPNSMVANWIQISDATPDDGYNLTGTLNCYDDKGELQNTIAVNIPNGGRRDFAGHDCLVGADNRDAVGTAQFVAQMLPNASFAEYYLTSTRYFYDCVGASCSNFLTAFVIPPRPPTTVNITGGVSTKDGLSVIELTNASEVPASAAVKIFDQVGVRVGNLSVSVPAYGTRHIIVNKNGANGYLANDTIGSAQVTTSSGQLSVLTLFYNLDPQTNKLLYGYAAPFAASAGEEQMSEFNSFINQQNDAEFYNSTGASLTAELDVLDYAGRLLLSSEHVLPAHTTKRFTLPVPKDTYGTLVIRAEDPGVVFRNHVFPKSKREYVLPFVGK